MQWLGSRWLCLSLIIWTAPLPAQVYEWVDESGKKHFSDQPPPQSDSLTVEKKTYEVINIDESMPAPMVIDPNRASRKAEEQQQKQQQAVRMARLCSEARQRLQTMSGPVNFLDDDGNVMEVTEKERSQRVKALESEIKQHCG